MNAYRGLFIVTGAALVACILGFVANPKIFLISYLVVVVTAASISAGALGVLMITYLVRRAWTEDLHGPLRAAALLLPLVGIAFIPVLLGVTTIYPWAGEGIHKGALQAIYLTPLFFALRTLGYFVILTALAMWTVSSYRRERMIAAASAGIIVWTLIVSFAGVDWLESIEPEFHSSIYGLFFVVASLLAGVSLGLGVILMSDRRRGSLAGYGALLLACLLVWAYVHAMQYWIVWSGNLPEEMRWYIQRLDHGWGFVLWGLYIGQFVLPFLALLSQRVRARSEPLLVLCGLTLAMRAVETAVLALPAQGSPSIILLLDLPAAATLVGVLAAIAIRLNAPERINRVFATATGEGPRSRGQARSA